MKRKNNQIILLSTAANVYQTETGAANRNLENLKEELNQVGSETRGINQVGLEKEELNQ